MEWKKINGFENKYLLSKQGKLESINYCNTNHNKILIPKKNKRNGILEITLSKENKKYYFSLARLMIETFYNIKLTKNDIVEYKDNNKDNCELDNLYVITRGKKQEKTYDNEKRYCPKYNYYGERLTTKEISKRNDIDPKNIRNRINKLYWNIYEAAEIPVAITNFKK